MRRIEQRAIGAIVDVELIAAALLDAARKRARPIVMTTIAMSAGMIPAAMGLGDGGELRAPMAIAVIGGLLVSTFLSLVFVPSFYTIMDDVAIWTARAFRWIVRPNEADEPGAETMLHGPATPLHVVPRKEMPIAAE